jgi:TRAP-type C4-dicarboxylate transport system substrate-binding protein
MHRSVTTVMAGIVLCAPVAQADTWRYTLEETLNDVQGIYARKFKEEIEAHSDHELLIYPYGTIGESADTMEQAQAGILQFIDQSPGFTGAVIPEAQIFFVPYLLPMDADHLKRFFRNSKAINQNLRALYADKGLELLVMFPEGEVVMATKEPVLSPEDLDEVKIRVMTNPLLVETYRAFGAIPTALPWGEVYGGLQTNLIQGQENPMFYIESSRIYEVTDVITYAGHSNFITAVMANKAFYDGLSANDKSLVQASAQAAFDYTVGFQKDLADGALKKIRAAKPEIQINVLTEEQRKPFRNAATAVEARFIEMTGESGRALLQQFKADLEATAEGS